MSTCHSCGTLLKPLFSSLYCPKDCDKREWKRYKDSCWYYIELKQGDRIPEDATHGWFMDVDEPTISGAIHYGPWSIRSRAHLFPKSEPLKRPIAVFKVVFTI